MGSSNLDQLGQGHIVYGTVLGTAVTCNDVSVTSASNAAGDFTLTFGDAFLSAPTVVASVVDGTFAAAKVNGVTIQAVTASTVQFNAWEAIHGATATTATDLVNALTDLTVSFVICGKRNN